ncbi:MAG: hypothetical protein QF411_08885, partial [Planctomycetota bacterium]|nr:hypothetical protein [Planctomycetota bacterium]
MRNAVRFLFLFGAGLVLLLILDWKQSDELLGSNEARPRRATPTVNEEAEGGEAASGETASEGIVSGETPGPAASAPEQTGAHLSGDPEQGDGARQEKDAASADNPPRKQVVIILDG